MHVSTFDMFLKISQRKGFAFFDRMVRTFLVLALLPMILAEAGCAAPAGRWQLVEIDPPGAAFPITQIEFGENGAYRSKGKFTADGEPTIKTHSATGKFSREDGLMKLAPSGHSAIGLSTRLRLDGKMVMTLAPPGRDWKVHGIFESVTAIDECLLDPETPITPESIKATDVTGTKE